MVICGVILSCKKVNQKKPGQSDNPQEISFNVSFKQSSGVFQTNSLGDNAVTNADTSLTNHLYMIQYMVFDAAGNYVSQGKQLFNDVNFGHVKILLQPGNYTIAFAGGKYGMEMVPSTGTLSTVYLWYHNGTSDSQNHYFKETSFYKAAITVGHANLTQNISLTRITSKIVFNIEDAIPQHAGVVTMQIIGGSGLLGFKYYIADGTVDSFDDPYDHNNFFASTLIPAAAIGTTNYQYSGDYLYSPTEPVFAAISINSSASGTILGNVTVPHIDPGGPNKLVILTGKLFGGTAGENNNGFNMFIDTTWNPRITKGF